MIIKTVELEKVCGPSSRLPENSLPEIAFAGKSNVGKSSLINALINRRSLARTSSQPGKTQTLNFYNVNKELYFVDLPGYGYAKASPEAKAAWGKMIENYLASSKQLKGILLLIDIRHEPGKNDIDMYNWVVYSGYDPVIIATKADKISRAACAGQVRLIRKTLGASEKTLIIPFSAVTKAGKEEIWKYIEGRLQHPARS